MDHWLLIFGVLVTPLMLAMGPYRRASWGDRAFLAAATTLVLYTAISFASMRLGMFSLASVGALVVLSAAGVSGWARLRDRSPTVRATSRWEPAALLVVLVALVAYESHPTWYLRAGRDPGPYVVFSTQIARSGGLDLDLHWLRFVEENFDGLVRLGYPAMYSLFERGMSTDPADIDAQFMHLYPALAANGYAAFGFSGLVRVNAVVTTMAVWAFYKLAERLVPAPIAVVAAAVLAANPAVIWAARIQMTEPLTLFLVLLGLYVLVRALDEHSPMLGPVAGFLLGLAVFARLDAAFSVMALVGASFASLSGSARQRRASLGAAGVFTVVSLLGWRDSWEHSRPYLLDLWSAGQTSKLMALNVGAAVVATLLALVPHRWTENRAWIDTASRGLVALAALILALWFGFDWFVRSLDVEDFNARIIRELAWYVTPVGYVLVPAGIAAVLTRRDWRQWLPVVALGGTTLFVFTWQAAISPDHMWASRRFVPYVIPMLVLLSTGGLATAYALERPQLRQGVVALGIAVVGFYGVHTWTLTSVFFGTSMLDGIVEDYEELVSVINRKRGERRVVFTREGQVASLLTYTFGIPTVLIDKPPNAATAPRLAGHVYISRAPNPYLREVTPLSYGGLYPELVRARRPRRLVNRTVPLWVGLVEPEPVSERTYAASDLSTRVGERVDEGEAIQSVGEAGTLVFGPYVNLRPGTYVIRWRGLVEAPGRATFAVTGDSGRVELARLERDLKPARSPVELGVLAFTVEQTMTRAEFKMGVDSELEVTVRDVVAEAEWIVLADDER